MGKWNIVVQQHLCIFPYVISHNDPLKCGHPRNKDHDCTEILCPIKPDIKSGPTLQTSILQNMLDKYGMEEQLLQAMGECGELVAVIQNFLRAQKYGHRKETLNDVTEEAVDVFFMMLQIRHMNPGVFDIITSEKVKKVLEKIENETPKK